MNREEDSRFRNLETKIGIFVALAIAGMIGAIILVGSQQDLFTKKITLHFTADRGTGFTKGMPVKLSGFRIGRIRTISLNEQAMVDIVIEVDSKYKKWIRSDSNVKLVKEGLIGDMMVEVSVGSMDKPELKDNDLILYVKTKALDELADEIAANVKPVLLEIRDIISYINNPQGDLKKSIHNLETLSRNLDQTRAHADTLLLSTNRNIDRLSGRTDTLLATANKKLEDLDLGPTISKLNTTMDSIDRNVVPILDKTRQTIENVEQISHQTRIMSEKSFPKIPGLLSQTEQLLFSSDQLMNSIRNSWLFRDGSASGSRPTGLAGSDTHD